MPALRPENLSPFGRLALKLDADFLELSRLAGQIERLDLEADGDLEHAVKLLGLFAQRGQDLQSGIQEFSQALLDVRDKSEAAAKQVEARALAIQERKRRQGELRQKLLQLEEAVRAANAGLTPRPAEEGTPSDEARARMRRDVERLDQQLAAFVATALAIKEEAAQTRFRGAERSAQSMHTTLQALRRKIASALSSS